MGYSYVYPPLSKNSDHIDSHSGTNAAVFNGDDDEDDDEDAGEEL